MFDLMAAIVAGLVTFSIVILMIVVANYGRITRRPHQRSEKEETFEERLADAVNNPKIERIEDVHHAEPFHREIEVNEDIHATDIESPISGRIMRDGRYRRLSSGSGGRKKDQDFRRPGPS